MKKAILVLCTAATIALCGCNQSNTGGTSDQTNSSSGSANSRNNSPPGSASTNIPNQNSSTTR